ncbi:hypothetical protein QR680_010614 [Steinernema hermaphroditum]|uniref:Uncharacterized protein n=1 Tax=Steinernema hermaphroditum TaxID=289476 RepID=A0AA39IR04_9BILA|nr:hypothetical protein QR680_010614 [Steinernema hermaphroditum]
MFSSEAKASQPNNRLHPVRPKLSSGEPAPDQHSRRRQDSPPDDGLDDGTTRLLFVPTPAQPTTKCPCPCPFMFSSEAKASQPNNRLHPVRPKPSSGEPAPDQHSRRRQDSPPDDGLDDGTTRLLLEQIDGITVVSQAAVCHVVTRAPTIQQQRRPNDQLTTMRSTGSDEAPKDYKRPRRRTLEAPQLRSQHSVTLLPYSHC